MAAEIVTFKMCNVAGLGDVQPLAVVAPLPGQARYDEDEQLRPLAIQFDRLRTARGIDPPLETSLVVHDILSPIDIMGGFESDSLGHYGLRSPGNGEIEAYVRLAASSRLGRLVFNEIAVRRDVPDGAYKTIVALLLRTALDDAAKRWGTTEGKLFIVSEAPSERGDTAMTKDFGLERDNATSTYSGKLEQVRTLARAVLDPKPEA